jgi:glycosyltransferase involved in cell wall biosynthesis
MEPCAFAWRIPKTIMETLQKPSRTEPWESRHGCTRELLTVRLKEYVSFDSFVCRKVVALVGLMTGFVLSLSGQTAKAFRFFSVIHRAAYSEWVSKIVERWVRAQLKNDGGATNSLAPVCMSYVDGLPSTPATARFHENPSKLLGTRVLVLKSPAPNEKGVVLIDYTFALSLFAKRFDVAKIARRYYVVLEPTWCGYCDLDILCYSKFQFPVFVQAPEPRDAAYLHTIGSNLIPFPVGGNWWVDQRVYKPLPGKKKDIDVVMIASWGRYKRHYKFFSALAKLRAGGERLKVVLVGYPADYTLDDMARQAAHYGIEDQLEVYEHLSAEEVNQQFNRAKINLLWSRKEGFNRAIIEGMFADVPCILRDGHNYGHQYPYINAQTGSFSSERDLPERLLWSVRNYRLFSPRDWVLQNMSCQKATAILEQAIRKVAAAAGENWTRGLALKVCYLNTMRYWDEDERPRFNADYAFLRSLIRT